MEEENNCSWFIKKMIRKKMFYKIQMIRESIEPEYMMMEKNIALVN